jgi:hypothetical protein
MPNYPTIVTRDRANGILLQYDMQPEEDMEGHGLSRTVLVQVHPPNEEPRVKDRGIRIRAGTAAEMTVKWTLSKNLPKPYGADLCIDTEDPTFVNPLKRFHNYSKTNCQIGLTTQNYQLTCGCIPIRNVLHVGVYGIPVCNLTQGHRCDMSKAREQTHNPCRKECKQIKYTVSTATKDMPNYHTETYLKAKINRTTYETKLLNRHFIKIRVNFEDLGFTEITQLVAYPLESALAEIGGMLGLTLGASVLTVLEMLEFWSMSLVYVCKHKYKSSKTDVEEDAKQTNSDIDSA